MKGATKENCFDEVYGQRPLQYDFDWLVGWGLVMGIA